jgi:hypothetical protein
MSYPKPLDLVRLTWADHWDWPHANKPEREVRADLPTYRVVGIDHFGRLWLTADDLDYDGYDADVIIGPDIQITDPVGWVVHLADDRTSIPWGYRLDLEVQ